MCLAVPVLVQKVDGSEGFVEIGGVTRSVSLTLTPGVKPGDYVLLHAGFAISILDEEEAEETLRLFNEMAGLYDPEGKTE